ncbi:MAG: ORF6N domain-containing protein [Bacilli bacterium]|nr:ORF6N domain-containing protein [Bacilli bacterium]
MNNNDIQILDKQTIESMIYTIRGQKVMLDFDLARIYGYSTKRFNEQVRNNIEKFPERYRFKLVKEELNICSRSKKSTLNNSNNLRGLNVKYLPYAFTEQGIYMLMTVLKGDLATKQSIALIDTFKSMKDYIIENSNILTNTNDYIESRFSSYDKRFEIVEDKIDKVMDNFIDPTKFKHYLILDGHKIESDVAYQEIYKLAKYSIYVIDDYISVKTLQLLKVCSDNINIIIITDNKAKNSLNNCFINDFKKDTKLNISFKKNNDLFHDRYVVIDYNKDSEVLYHCGHSSKDSGNSVCTIDRIEEKELYKVLIDKVLNNE